MVYYVSVPEVHYQGRYVEAESPEEAREKVANGEGIIDGDNMEYSHMCEEDIDNWPCEVCKDEDGFIKRSLEQEP